MSTSGMNAVVTVAITLLRPFAQPSMELRIWVQPVISPQWGDATSPISMEEPVMIIIFVKD